MKKIASAVIAIACVIALAACSTAGSIGTVLSGGVANPVTAKAVFELRSGYDAAFLVGASTYAQLPRCSKAPAPCSQQNIVNELRRVDRVVEPALTRLETFVLNNPKLDASALYAAAVSAIAEAKTVSAEYHIGG